MFIVDAWHSIWDFFLGSSVLEIKKGDSVIWSVNYVEFTGNIILVAVLVFFLTLSIHLFADIWEVK